ncbi:MAG: pyridoxal phosphate-dependent decarboxylase family protein [Caulobacteraceae bacterium]
MDRIRADLPVEGEPFEIVYEDLWRDIAPYTMHNIHPRHWGWVNGSGVPVAVLGDMLATGLNANCALFNQMPNHVEIQVVNWLTEMLGMPSGSGGLLVSGGSMANLNALHAARCAKAGYDVRKLGTGHGPRLTVYTSDETHSSVQKGLEMMGLGSDSLVVIPTDENFRLDVAAAARRIAEDRAAGLRPIAIVANAGTVNTGAVDPLNAIADLCEAEDLWMHIDGAFGALAWLDPRQRERLAGMPRADSIACDGHKWLYQPYSLGCLLVKNPELLRNAFELTPSYLTRTPGSVADAPLPYGQYGIELSRPFRALKLWMSLRVHGVNAFSQAIARNIDQAGYLARKVDEHPDLERVAPVELNVVCFRYSGAEAKRLNDINIDLLAELQKRGVATPSLTFIKGAAAIRVAITNHRSRTEDFDMLVDASAAIGAELAG